MRCMMNVPDDHPPHFFMWGRTVQGCAGGTEYDATPPLVAAPPVPPVVPDSEALGHDDRCESDFISGPNLYGPCGCADRSGSGVVPDKPALAPEPACSTCNDTGTVVVYEGNNDVSYTYDLPCTDCAEDVPAVTDDEAATKVIYDALDDEHADYYTPLDDVAARLVLRLRSAGFLIVHPMQRGPEDPTFVMPDITAVHHTKET